MLGLWQELLRKSETKGPCWLIGYSIAQYECVDLLRRDIESELRRTPSQYRQEAKKIAEEYTAFVAEQTDALMTAEQRVVFLEGFEEAIESFNSFYGHDSSPHTRET